MTTRIITGDCRDVLPTLNAESVQCVVTSPPYFGLRDYGTADWDGGDADCDHAPERKPRTERQRSGQPGSLEYNDSRDMPYRDTCGKCGAVRIDRQIGLEPTVDAYVAELVAVFREVRRVLRDDGTLWLNLGDSYNAYNGNRGASTGEANQNHHNIMPSLPRGRGLTTETLKPKDLIGIPWRVAFALQADGWYLRQDIIWAKPNPMPESVTDRCTKSHEYLFLLTKSARYYYDAAAIAEQSDPAQHEHNQRYARPYDNLDRIAGGQPGNVNHVGIHARPGNGTRNKRSVWTVSTTPYADAHFATFPGKLIEPCILAGSREGDTVLDPFGGSGTTGEVATRLGRNAILIELNPAYRPLIERRTAQQGLPLLTVEVPA